MCDVSGKGTRVSRMVNLNYEEKENYENRKNEKDLYFDYLRSNMNVGRNSMMMKENYKGGYFSDMFLQRGQSFPDKKNKGAFFIFFSLLFHITNTNQT